MDSPNYPKSDPSLLLLNEIEILLAQTRLMELYLKQAQVTAANDAARIQEQHQAELAALRYALEEKEQLLTARQNTVKENEKNLFQQVQNLEHRVGDQQRRLDDYDTQLHQADSEIAALRERIAQLQTAKTEAEAAAQQAASTRQELQSALTALRRELEDNQRDFQRQQLVSRALQENLHAQLEQLRSQLAEKQAWAAAGVELQQAKIEIAELRQRVAELQASRQEVEAAAARALEQTRARLETELAGLQTALSERERTLGETQRAIGAIEHSLRAEIDTLRIQLSQKQALIESRDGELRAAHEQIAALQQRVIELETAHRQAAAKAAEAIELRGSFESEISTLRHEVAVRERALSERQEAVTAVELALHGKIQALQQELAHGRSAIEARASEVQNARGEAAALRERMSQLESAAETHLAARQFAEGARQNLEAELAKVNAALAHKETVLAEHEARFQALENHLRGEIGDLRIHLEEQKQRVEQSHSELERLRSEIALLQEHKAQSEQARRELEQDLQQATALRQELEGHLQAKEDELRGAQARADEQKEAALLEQEARFKSDEEQLGSDLAVLRSQLDQQQTTGELARQERIRLQAEISSLREQNTQSETSRREIEQNWQQAASLRQEVEARLQAKEDDLRTFQSRANEEKEIALTEQQARYQALEAELGSEIGHLRFQLEQQQKNFEQGNVELGQLRAETAALQEQKELSEQARREIEQNWQQAAALRQDFERRLRAKEEELHAVQSRANEMTEVALREQEARFRSTEEQLGSELALLRNQLVHQQDSSEHARAEFARLQTEISGLREQTVPQEAFRRELEQNALQTAALRQDFEARLRAKEDELRALQSRANEEKDVLLREQEARYQALEAELGSEIGHLRFQLEQQQRDFDQGNLELGQLRAETTALQEQKELSEQARREIEQNWQQAAALRQDFEIRLRDKQDELRAAQAKADEIKSQIEAKLAELQLQLTERQLLAESRAAEIDNLRSELGALVERLAVRDAAAEELKVSLLNEAASSRAAHQAELATLREDHDSRQDALEVQLAQQSAQIAGLLGQIHELERRTTESESEIQDRERNIGAAMAESAALRTRTQELESLRQTEKAAADSAVEQVRAKSEAELAALRHEVQQKAWALAQQQASMENLALTHRNQIQKLEERLTEQLRSIQDRNREDEREQSQTRSLQRRIEELEMELQHAQLTAARGAEQVREEYARRIETLNAEVARHSAALQEREESQTQSERNLRAEIDRLMRETQEKNLILQNRNDELVRVKSDRDALQESYKDLATVTTRNEAVVSEDAELMRTEFQAQLALLQAELSQKEWALEEQRAAASGMDLAHREQMETLRQRLAQMEARSQENPDKFVLGDETLTEEQQQRRNKYREVIDAVTSDDRSFPASENRRWRSRFGWKRRWK